jgi:uncharacterized protein (DUF362 family)
MDPRRRDLLRGGAALPGVLLVSGPALGCAREAPGGPAAGSRPRVVVVRAPRLAAAGSPERGVLRRALEAGLRALAGTADARAALARVCRSVDVVGLKVNCLAGRQMSTRVELVEELVALLAATGLPRQNAIVFDRSDGDLRRGGFPVREGGSDYRSVGNDRAGYEGELSVMPSGASRLARVASAKASVLINLPVLKDHGLAGVSGALKNNFGLIHNPNKFHLGGCDPHVAEVNGLDPVRRKQRLVICDALTVQSDGGPGFHPAAAVREGVLLFAHDPVAHDVIAWELLERLRARRKLPTLAADKRRPVHIAGAARARLGVGERARIELVELKVT